MIFLLFWLTFVRFFCPNYMKPFVTTRKLFRDLFCTDQGNGSGMTFVTGATKINFKNLKT